MARPDDLLDEPEIARVAHERYLSSGYREAARRALDFARRYRAEEGAAGGTRERECIAQAHGWRRVVRDLHAGLPVPAVPVSPGVVRARTERAPESGSGRKTG